jgi:hypothetical protein
MRDFYNLINQQPESMELSWAVAAAERVKFYEDRGCRKGDAVIAAHAEALRVGTIVSENRQFLQTIEDFPMESRRCFGAIGLILRDNTSREDPAFPSSLSV